MKSYNDIIFFCIAQGSLYEKMTENFFYSLKFFHPNIKTACISHNNINYCDYFFKISDLCPKTNNINEASINGQSYSFKLGTYQKIPREFLDRFKKIIFYDSDSLCLNPIRIDESIYSSKLYVPWCQSIVTEDPNIKKNINEQWIWSGATFQKHRNFAELYNIKEWKNINAGMIVIEIKELNNLIDLYYSLTNKIYNFYGNHHGTEELTLSLMITILDPSYKTPNICNNSLGQLCMNDSIENVKKNKKFLYYPWFNSSGKKYYEVLSTCVHFPGEKNTLSSVVQ